MIDVELLLKRAYEEGFENGRNFQGARPGSILPIVWKDSHVYTEFKSRFAPKHTLEQLQEVSASMQKAK